MTWDLDNVAEHIGAQVEKLVGKQTFTGNGQKVFIASGRYDKIGSPIELIVGFALAKRDVDIRYLLCDQAMLACDVRRCDRDTQAICDQCQNNGQLLFNKTGLPALPFSQWLHPDDVDEITAEVDSLPTSDYLTYEYAGVKVGRTAYASTLRHFLRGDLHTEEHYQKFRHFLITSLLIVRLMQRLHAEEQPDALFVSHGVYVTWGIVTEYAVLHHIRVVVYGYGYRRGTILLSLNGTYHDTLAAEGLEHWAQTPLSTEQETQTREYLLSRANGGLDWIHYNTAKQHSTDQLRHLLAIPPNKPIYTLFTNITWDAAIVFRDATFPSMDSWLKETLCWAIDHPEIELIVRCHPAEVKVLSDSHQRAEDVINAAFPTLPDHIHIIAPDGDVNTYDLAGLADLVLIYTTKVGLEFATRNLPIVVAGEAFYRNKGFTYDPATPEDYFALLTNTATVGTTRTKTTHSDIYAASPLQKQPSLQTPVADLAMRYAHYYFFRRYLELPGLNDQGMGQPVLSIDVKSLDELAEGQNGHIDVICNTILRGDLPHAPED